MQIEINWQIGLAIVVAIVLVYQLYVRYCQTQEECERYKKIIDNMDNTVKPKRTVNPISIDDK